jgi:hypothetical protein
MAGEFVARTWSPEALAPSAEGTTFGGELVLDRLFLGVTDGSVSRAENAPRIRATSASTVEVEVPERSARFVVAIEGLRFEDLQRQIRETRTCARACGCESRKVDGAAAEKTLRARRP